MNKPLATALLAASSLLLADGALAADACGTPRNAFDSVYCRSGEFSQADRELNQQFGTLRKHLNDGQKALLKKSQIAWIKERDAACSESKDNGYFVNLDCATETRRNGGRPFLSRGFPPASPPPGCPVLAQSGSARTAPRHPFPGRSSGSSAARGPRCARRSPDPGW